MPWCPKCGAEYTPGFDVCVGCKAPLIEHNPAPLQPWYSRRPAIGIVQFGVVWAVATAIIVLTCIVGLVLSLRGTGGTIISSALAIYCAFLLGYVANDWLTWPYIWLGWAMTLLLAWAMICLPVMGQNQPNAYIVQNALAAIAFFSFACICAASTLIGQRYRQSHNGLLLLIPCAGTIVTHYVFAFAVFAHIQQ